MQLLVFGYYSIQEVTHIYMYLFFLPTTFAGNSSLQQKGTLLSFFTELILEIDSTNSYITVAWHAPFSSTATYSVLIYNITDEDNPTAVSCTDCHNITKTRYTFCADYRIPCYMQCRCKYNFSVIPYNELGPGESSQNITGYTLKGELLYLYM